MNYKIQFSKDNFNLDYYFTHENGISTYHDFTDSVFCSIYTDNCEKVHETEKDFIKHVIKHTIEHKETKCASNVIKSVCNCIQFENYIGKIEPKLLFFEIACDLNYSSKKGAISRFVKECTYIYNLVK